MADTSEVDDSIAREAVLRVFNAASDPLYADQIARRLNLPIMQVIRVCDALMEDGLVGAP